MGWPGFLQAQAPVRAGSALQASSILNPNISVLGWFQGEAGQRKLGAAAQAPSLELKEAEVSIQSVVDPYARADFFIAIEGEGKLSLEEGTLKWFSFPGGFSLKVGKFHANFGRFNRIHRPETAFADRPAVYENFFGEESLSSPGASLSWHVPNPWIFINADLEATSAPESSETPAFGRARRGDLLYVGRLGAFYDITEYSDFSLGGSYAGGPAGQEWNAVMGSSSTLRTQLYGLDFAWRWRSSRRGSYRTLKWQTEILWNARDLDTLTRVKSFGFFSHLEWQFARRWHAGTRYDWSESPSDGDRQDKGALAYLTFTPSEFSLISLQGRQTRKSTGETERAGFLKVTFNIGPHGMHPF